MSASRMGNVLQLVGIGWYVGICIAGGSFSGLWLDRKFDTAPLFTLLGLAVGILIALVGMFRMLKAVLSDDAGPDESSGSTT